MEMNTEIKADERKAFVTEWPMTVVGLCGGVV